MLGGAFADDDLPEFSIVQHLADVIVAGQQGLWAHVEFGIDLDRLWGIEFMREDAQVGFEAQPVKRQGSVTVGGSSDVTVGLEGVNLTGSGTATVQAVNETLPVPEGHVFGSAAFKFSLTSKDGSSVSLTTPVTLRVKYTKDDIAKAGDGGKDQPSWLRNSHRLSKAPVFLTAAR